MWITTDQAAEIYARFCKARYGNNAPKIIEQKTLELRRKGDTEGERAWTKVKDAMEKPVAH